MNQVTELTLEQEFGCKLFAEQVQRMSHEQAQEFLIEQNRLMVVRETLYREFLKQAWQLGSEFTTP